MTKGTGNPVGRPPKHGAYSGRELIPVTAEKVSLVRGLLAGTVLAIGPTDAVAIDLLGRNLAKIEIIDRWLQAHGLFEELTNEPQPILRIYWQAMNAAMRACDALGLTPTARVRLGIGVAHAERDMAAEMAAEREAG